MATLRDSTPDAFPWAFPDAPYRYRAFGLTISCAFPLPELTPAPDGGGPDLVIALAGSGRPLPSRGEGTAFDLFAPDGHYLAWPEVAAFRVLGPDRIEVEPWSREAMAYVAYPLLGPVLAFVLHLRGLLVLHASAVDMGGRGVMFVGDKMAGKSTTAAAFLRAGHRLLTDDLLAIDLADAAAPRILPAYAQLKLSPEASSAIAVDAQTLPLAHPGFEKRQHRLNSPFSHREVAPGTLYVLQRGGERPRSETLTGAAALQAVLRFSYVTRFGKAALPGRAEADHLARCARFARATRIARLHIPAALDRLDETVALVAEDRP